MFYPRKREARKRFPRGTAQAVHARADAAELAFRHPDELRVIDRVRPWAVSAVHVLIFVFVPRSLRPEQNSAGPLWAHGCEDPFLGLTVPPSCLLAIVRSI